MKDPMHSQEDILRKAEEFRTGNIHEAANRYFSGNMSVAEVQAFDSVLVQDPVLEEEVKLQGFAFRSARVAGRVSVREKLAQASARARQREQIRSRQRVVRTMVRVAVPAMAACLILGVLLGWGGPSTAKQTIHFADVNSFGVMYAPDSPGGAKQASLYRVEGEDYGFLKVSGSFRIRLVEMEQQQEAGRTYADLNSNIHQNTVQNNNSLRWALCAEMRSLGLPVRDPIRLQNQRWEEESTVQLAEMEKSGFAMHYPPLTGFLAEEDPGLDRSTLILPSQRSKAGGGEGESAINGNAMQGRFWVSPPFEV